MNLRQVALWIGFAVLMTAGAYGLYVYLSHPVKSAKPKAQQIAVLRQQPPPPPPKPQEKPKEQEVKKEEVKLPDPEPQQAKDEPPPAQDLGVDAQGGAGTDGFGLVGRPGGRDITTIGGEGNGAGRSKFAAFASQVETFLQEELARNNRLRTSDYRTALRLWFRPDGRIERAELVGSTGDAEIDAALRAALADLRPLRAAPPPDMPQPMQLRLTSRGAG